MSCGARGRLGRGAGRGPVRLQLIAAACEGGGIGANGALPWRLKKEMAYFTSMTSGVADRSKINAVIMGRRTWDCIPPKYRPLVDRVNIVLTRNVDAVRSNVPEDVVVCGGLDEAVAYIEGRDDIESTWVIGGSSIYEAAMKHPNCGKIYLTEIQKSFDCDTFFPTIKRNAFSLIDIEKEREQIPAEKQTEGDISYFYRVYKKL